MKTITTNVPSNKSFRIDNQSDCELSRFDPYYVVVRDSEGNGTPLPVAVQNGCGSAIRFLQRWVAQHDDPTNDYYKFQKRCAENNPSEKNERFLEMLKR